MNQNQSTEVVEVLSMRKGPCFGTCPVYTITLFSDHSMVFRGVRYTDKPGIFEKILETDLYDETMALVENSDFKSLDDEYPTMVSDMASTTITYYFEDTSKVVKAYNESPRIFDQIEEIMKNWAESDGWQSLTEQESEDVENQIIIQLKKAVSPESLVESFEAYNLNLLKRISPKLPYYLFSYDQSTIAKEEIIITLIRHEDVVHAEFNQKVSIR